MAPVLTSILAFKQSLTGGAFEALAAGSSDSLTIISYPDSANAYVEEIWSGNSAHKMEVAVFSPRFGDNQYGLRMQHMFNPTLSGADGDPQLLLPRELDIPVYSSDQLNVQVNGTASDNADVVLQLYYEHIQGAGQRLATWDQVSPMIAQANQGNQSRVLGIEVTVTPGATGNYGTAVALNANDDRLQADYDYALLGFTVDQPATSFGIKGPDTGYYRIAFPGHWDQRITADWFVQQAKQRGTPHIPIINANNKATTFLDGVSSNNAGATKVSLVLAQLASRFNG
jgi:hypothetical protein